MVNDPRLVVSREGIAAEYGTYTADGSTITYDPTQPRGSSAVDLAVGLVAAGVGTVELVADGEHIIGRLERVENDLRCTVQVEGYTHLPGGVSAALTDGKRAVGALGASSARGYIREANTAVAAELAGPDTTIIDGSVSTAVEVSL